LLERTSENLAKASEQFPETYGFEISVGAIVLGERMDFGEVISVIDFGVSVGDVFSLHVWREEVMLGKLYKNALGALLLEKRNPYTIMIETVSMQSMLRERIYNLLFEFFQGDY